MIDMLPDDGYYHSMFGSDNEKCPKWFAVVIGLSMIFIMGTIGLSLIGLVL